MNLSNEIQSWLDDNGSFNAGIQLLRRTGRMDKYHQARQHLTLPFITVEAKTQLRQFLRDHLTHHPPITAAAVNTPPAKPVEPPEVKKVRELAKHHLKERDARRAQLVQMADHRDRYTDQDRYLLCEEIMIIQQEIDSIYERITSYEKDGKLPEAVDSSNIVEDTVKKFQRVLSLRPAISRANKKLENKQLTNTERQELETDLLDKMIELEDLETQLGL